VFKPLEPRAAKPLPLADVKLKKPLVAKKNRSSSSPAGAGAQIAPPGRSGILLRPSYIALKLPKNFFAKKLSG
jgi:hypothetical protein